MPTITKRGRGLLERKDSTRWPSLMFWVKIYRSSHRYRVRLFQTRALMMRYAKRNRLPVGEYAVAACVSEMTRRRDIGELLFSLDDVSVSTVAHECQHALVHVAMQTRWNLDVKSEAHEHFCEATGRMIGEVYWRCHGVRPRFRSERMG